MNPPILPGGDRVRAIRSIEARGIVVRRWPPPPDDAVLTWAAPTLHLVDPLAPPPPCGVLDDWAREPAEADELLARADTLLARSRHDLAPSLVLDGDGVLRVAGSTVVLSPTEHLLFRALLASLGHLVSTEELAEACGTAGPPHLPKRALASLRKKLRGHPLRITTVRDRGAVLEAVDAVPAAAGPSDPAAQPSPDDEVETVDPEQSAAGRSGPGVGSGASSNR